MCVTATAGAEILVCIASAMVSLRVAYRAKKEVHKKNEGTFSVTVFGQRDISINVTKEPTSEDDLSDPAMLSAQSSDHLQPPHHRLSDTPTEPLLDPITV